MHQHVIDQACKCYQNASFVHLANVMLMQKSCHIGRPVKIVTLSSPNRVPHPITNKSLSELKEKPCGESLKDCECLYLRLTNRRFNLIMKGIATALGSLVSGTLVDFLIFF